MPPVSLEATHASFTSKSWIRKIASSLSLSLPCDVFETGEEDPSSLTTVGVAESADPKGAIGDPNTGEGVWGVCGAVTMLGSLMIESEGRVGEYRWLVC